MKLSAKQRSEIPESDFGIPEERKFPLIDKNHVILAIRYFGSCPDDKKKALAKRITEKAKEFGVKINPKGTFAKYAPRAACECCGYTSDYEIVQDASNVGTLSPIVGSRVPSQNPEQASDADIFMEMIANDELTTRAVKDEPVLTFEWVCLRKDYPHGNPSQNNFYEPKEVFADFDAWISQAKRTFSRDEEQQYMLSPATQNFVPFKSVMDEMRYKSTEDIKKQIECAISGSDPQDKMACYYQILSTAEPMLRKKIALMMYQTDGNTFQAVCHHIMNHLGDKHPCYEGKLNTPHMRDQAKAFGIDIKKLYGDLKFNDAEVSQEESMMLANPNLSLESCLEGILVTESGDVHMDIESRITEDTYHTLEVSLDEDIRKFNVQGALNSMNFIFSILKYIHENYVMNKNVDTYAPEYRKVMGLKVKFSILFREGYRMVMYETNRTVNFVEQYKQSSEYQMFKSPEEKENTIELLFVQLLRY